MHQDFAAVARLHYTRADASLTSAFRHTADGEAIRREPGGDPHVAVATNQLLEHHQQALVDLGVALQAHHIAMDQIIGAIRDPPTTLISDQNLRDVAEMIDLARGLRDCSLIRESNRSPAFLNERMAEADRLAELVLKALGV